MTASPPSGGSELSRLVDARQAEGLAWHLEATPAECAALAQRFGLVQVDRLTADVELHRKGRKVEATGNLAADIVQSCAISAEDLQVRIDEPLFFRFVPENRSRKPDEEIELDADDCDEIEYAGTHFDLGEAVAQSLGLAIDPYLTGPNAEAARRSAGLASPEDVGPFAALKGLKARD